MIRRDRPTAVVNNVTLLAKVEIGDAYERPASLAGFLSADSWTTRELEIPESLLGEVITNTTRLFIGGETGIGKSNFGFAMAGGLSTGGGLLHWRSFRPCRVLYIDGEMARDLVKERLIDLKARMGVADLPNLFVLCLEDCEELAATHPDLGEFRPLNTKQGQDFILNVINLLAVDVVFFDNRMSLLEGDMKDELPWTQTMPLVKAITNKRIGQVWFDHMGNDTSRLYGTKTKEWSFDSVAILEKKKRSDTDVSFTMTFTKARRRKKSNRADFEPITVALVDEQWEVEGGVDTVKRKAPSPAAQSFHRALLDAIIAHGSKGSCTRDQWRAECCRLGILENPTGDKTLDRKQDMKMNKYRAELVDARWIGVNGEKVTNLTTT